MKKRSFELLSYLMINKEYLQKTDALAKWFHVTERTIRNDVQETNGFLKSHGLPELLISDNGTITIHETLQYDQILKHITVNDYYSYRLSVQERWSLVQILILLDNGSYITIDRISDRLKVSRSTIVNDLEEIRFQLDRMQIKLETKTNKGLRVSEKESRIRNLLTDMLIQKSWSSTPVFYQMLLDLFDPVCSWPEIQEFVRTFHKKKRKELDQDTLQTICSCFFTVLNRSCKGVHPSLTEVLDVEMLDGSQWIVQLGESLFSAFGLELSNNERRYFLSYLQNHITQPKAASEESVNIQVMTAHFLYKLSDRVGMDLYNDTNLFENLVNHIDSTMRSKRKHHMIFNPYCQEIQQEYAELYRDVELIFQNLETYFEYSFSDHELAYIVMHVKAAMQKNNQSLPISNILVICQSGYATSVLLATQLVQNFHCKILATLPVGEIQTFEEMDKVDLIVSSCELTLEEKDVIVVNPILTTNDIFRIQKKIYLLDGKETMDPNAAREKDLQVFLQARAQHGDKTLTRMFLSDLEKLKGEYLEKIRQINKKPLLIELLNSRSIQIRKQVPHWKAAVEAAGNLLLEQNVITQEYIDAIISNTLEHGPYYVITRGVVLAHARPEQGAKSPGLSILLLKEPVLFGHEEFDPVSLVFCLSTSNSSNTVQALEHLIRLCKQPLFLEDLKHAANEQEVCQVIRIYENGLLRS